MEKLNLPQFITVVVLSMTLGASSCFGDKGFEAFRISSNSDFEKVERSVAESDADEVFVSIAEGEYSLGDTFHINRSNVSIFGEGSVLLRLKDSVNKPTLAIGTQKSYPLNEDAISNVVVMSISIDGNKEAQSSELDRDRPWIRNNGIDARAVRGLRLENVVSNNNRSGGFVISWKCADVYVLNSSFSGNYFDGMAYYDSDRVFSIDCVSSDNRSAGVSLDNDLKNCLFLRCRLERNGDVGVFARNSKRLIFEKCFVADSGDWAFFLAHDDKGMGIHDSVISTCSITGNRGGVRMASETEAQSSGNIVYSNSFNSNEVDGRRNVESCGSEIRKLERFDVAARIQELEKSKGNLSGLRPKGDSSTGSLL